MSIEAREGEGWLEERDGRLVLHTRGLPYQEGFQHGRLLRDQVRACLREVWHEGWLAGSPLLPRWLWVAYARLNERHLTTDERRELQGLAEGAGLRYDDVLVMNSQNLAEIAFHWLAAGGCTQLVAAAPATSDGHLRIGRNLDTVNFERLPRYAVVQVHHPARGYAFLTPGFAGKVLDAVSGWNARGLHVSQDDAELRWQNPIGVYSGALVRRLVQHCADVEHAEATVRGVRRLAAAGKILILVDGREARVLEIRQRVLQGMVGEMDVAVRRLQHTGDAESAARRVGEGADAPGTIQLTNHYRSWLLAAGSPPPSRSSRLRLQRLRALVAQHYGRIDDAAAIAILTDRLDLETGMEEAESDRMVNWHGPRVTRFGPFRIPETLTVRVATTISTVSDLTAGRMWIGSGPAWVNDPSHYAVLDVLEELAK